MIAWQLQNFLWCILTPDNTWMLYGMWAFGGVVGSGFVLAFFNFQLRTIPPAAKTLAISINLAFTSLITATGPIIGGKVLQHLLLDGGNSIDVYHRIFLVQPVLALLACLLLVRVHEPAASSLSTVVGAMRNIRTLGGVFGLSILMDYVFVKRPRQSRRARRTNANN
jgi:MFS family permease